MPQLIVYGIGYYLGGTLGATLALAAYSVVQQRTARRRARDAYNAALTDRQQMVDLTPDSPRTMALGRVRCVEGVRRRWTSGVHDEKLTLVVSFAGHEIDGFETFYFNDTALTLDGSGYVLTAPYTKVVNVSKSQTITLDGSGGGTVSTALAPIADSLSATIETVTATIDGTIPISASAVGTTITVSGGTAGASCNVVWQESEGRPQARIRTWLGAAGQNVGSALAAEYPGKITATDKFSDMAVAVIDLNYDPDVFPQGIPNITALLRGAKTLDPRTSTTYWSENPALHAYHYARHANGWAVPVAEIRTADVIAAANECDISTVFTLRKPDTTTYTATLPRYRCGITSDSDPRASMDEIFEAMAGRWGWGGGTWRMRAGVSAAPVFSMDYSWIAQRMDETGLPAGAPLVQISNGVPRESKINRITGRCVDPDQRWQVLPFPAVEDAVVIAAEGRTYAQEVEYQGVNHIAHAQHLAAIAIRQGQAGLRMETTCNLNAYRCELFDVGSVSLPVFGFEPKLMEVMGWRWSPTEGVRLSWAETAAAIYEPAELDGRDPAPNGTLPPPFVIEQIGALTVTSGTTTLADGSVLVRTKVEWPAVTAEAIRRSGHVEVQYVEAMETLPAGDWPSWPESGDSTQAVIPGLKAGYVYVFRARAVNTTLGVNGKWSVQKPHRVAGAPLVQTGQLAEDAVNEDLILSSTNYGYSTIS